MSFEERGVIVIGKKDKNGKMIDKERAEDIAIEAGAEEVGMEEEDEGKEKGADDGTDVPTWTLYTMARDVMSVKGKIDELQDIEILEAQVRYLPVHYVLLNEKDAATAATLIERLQELEEVSMIHDNIKPSEA